MVLLFGKPFLEIIREFGGTERKCDRCAHRGGPLSEDIVHGGLVTCPLHNWVYDLETGEAQGADGGALGETLSLEGRLLYPEIGGQRANWDDVLDLVASTFARTIAEHGPESVAFYGSGQLLTEDYYVANKLMKGFIGSGNIDTNSRLCMASPVAGHRRAFGSDIVPGNYEDIEQADLLVLVGSNLAWCHPVIYQRLARAKIARPGMVPALSAAPTSSTV